MGIWAQEEGEILTEGECLERERERDLKEKTSGKKGWKKGEKKDTLNPFKFYPRHALALYFDFISQIAEKENLLFFIPKFSLQPNIIIIENWNFMLATIAEIKIPENEYDGLGGILGKK